MIDADNIEQSWANCFSVWKEHGRVQDYLRTESHPRYSPNCSKRLGVEFAKTFQNQFSFIITKLDSTDPVEKLCAFEILELICWEYGYNNVPQKIYSITIPLPHLIANEVEFDAEIDLDYNDPKRKKLHYLSIGHFLSKVFTDELPQK